MHCFMLQLNKDSDFFINYYMTMQQSENLNTWADGRELQYFSVLGFFNPCRFFSVLYFLYASKIIALLLIVISKLKSYKELQSYFFLFHSANAYIYDCLLHHLSQ